MSILIEPRSGWCPRHVPLVTRSSTRLHGSAGIARRTKPVGYLPSMVELTQAQRRGMPAAAWVWAWWAASRHSLDAVARARIQPDPTQTGGRGVGSVAGARRRVAAAQATPSDHPKRRRNGVIAVRTVKEITMPAANADPVRELTPMIGRARCAARRAEILLPRTQAVADHVFASWPDRSSRAS
jgi:hypothetical protein